MVLIMIIIANIYSFIYFYKYCISAFWALAIQL